MEQFESRKFVIRIVVILFGLAFIIRLFYLQVYDESLKAKASDIGISTQYPARGLIYDRFGKLIVTNEPIYDLLVVQKQVNEIDTVLFCSLLGISDSLFHERFRILQENKGNIYSRYKPEPFISQIPKEVFARFEEHLHQFPGFYPQVKMVRSYPYKSAAHVLGDIGEVSPEEREASNYYYKLGELVGKSGLEKYYEKELRGNRGVKYYLRDNIGRVIGSFQNGMYDTSAVSGKNLTTTLDIELQVFGELLMQNKRGSIVAIEPKTGEILAFVSSPSYDPNLLVGRNRGKNFTLLSLDSINKPLINRPLSAMYPPGSIFKAAMGLAAWQEGAIDFQTGYGCAGAYILGGLRVGCHGHATITNLNQAIQYSCNAYFCNSLKKFLELSKYSNESEALTVWDNYMYSFGMGKPTGIDLPGEKSGNIPTPEYYDRQYKGWRWRASTVISIAFGQGETLLTPLQMAYFFAIISNNGVYKKPHLALKFEQDTDALRTYDSLYYSMVDSTYFKSILPGLEDAVRAGTARLAYNDSIRICGKTGTAENPHGKDHSIFAAFAPADNPKIAIAVIVENSGFGGTWAAPIASLMIEKYLNRKISNRRAWLEQRILDANFLE